MSHSPASNLDDPLSKPSYANMNSNEKKRSCLPPRRSKMWWLVVLGLPLLIVAIALAVGLGVGLTRGGGGEDCPACGTTVDAPSLGDTTNATNGTFWEAKTGDSWQIVLLYALENTSTNASVYDIDLFDNNASTIDALHAENRKVICYFSAGSYEDFRPDSDKFDRQVDYGKGLDGWAGENWLNTNSSNVRDIMAARLRMAADMGCDGVDPDNIDGYENDSGFDLTQADAINYLTFLAIEAHTLGMAIGLKNGGDIVNATLDMMQWEVNEQCVEYQECSSLQPFIDAGKPVFHIEYPDDVSTASTNTDLQTKYCDSEANDSIGFSTVLKNMDLDDFVYECPST